VASEANDTAAQTLRRHGFVPQDYPPFTQAHRLLPLLFGPVYAHVHDQDLAVREAAIAACILLVDDARLRQHRAMLITLVREVLGASTVWQYRERAIETLEDWGEDATGLVGRDPWAFINADLPGCSHGQVCPNDKLADQLPF
jgi:hypothetical protein